MQTSSQNSRGESVTVLSANPLRSFNAAEVLGVDPSGVKYTPEHFSTHVDMRKIDAAPIEMRRVLAEAVVSLKAPDGHVVRTKLRAGKIVAADQYDFASLTSQGVKLSGPIDPQNLQHEIAIEPQRVTGPGLSVKDVIGVLGELGFDVTPRANKDPDVQAQIAALQAQLAQLQRAANPPSDRVEEKSEEKPEEKQRKTR